MDQNLGQQRDVENARSLDHGAHGTLTPNVYNLDGFRAHESSAINGSFLAQGLGPTNPAISVGHQASQSSENAGDHHVAVIPRQETRDQPGVTNISPHEPSKYSIASSSPILSTSPNTWMSNIAQPLSVSKPPHMTQNHSNLRNRPQPRNSFSQNTNNLQPQQQQQLYPTMSQILDHIPNAEYSSAHQPHQAFSTSDMRTPMRQSFSQFNSGFQLPHNQDHSGRPFTPLPSINDHFGYRPSNNKAFSSPHSAQQSMQHPMQPRPQPQTYVSEVSAVSKHVPKVNVAAPPKMKSEKSSPRSTTRPKRRSTITVPDEIIHTSSPKILHSTEGLTGLDEDRTYIKDLVAAMLDGDSAEDNEGMIKTWKKLSLNNEAKLEQMAIELLARLKESQQHLIGDKKSVNQYENFHERFEAMCKTLRTQKTVCKHLSELPYSQIVAMDPTYAATRVINNRRVNDQKKQAINVGRKALGQKGHGKGRKVSAIPDDEQVSDELFDSDNDSHTVNKIKPEPRSEPRRTRKAKRTHRRADDDDSDYEVSKSASKKSKRGTRRSMYEVKSFNGENVMVDTSEHHHGELQSPSSSAVQNNEVHYGDRQVYATTLPRPYHQQQNQNGFENNQGHQYDGYCLPYNYSSTADPTSSPHYYSSGADHTPSEDFNGNDTYSSNVDHLDEYGPVSYEGEYGNIAESGY